MKFFLALLLGLGFLGFLIWCAMKQEKDPMWGRYRPDEEDKY